MQGETVNKQIDEIAEKNIHRFQTEFTLEQLATVAMLVKACMSEYASRSEREAVACAVCNGSGAVHIACDQGHYGMTEKCGTCGGSGKLPSSPPDNFVRVPKDKLQHWYDVMRTKTVRNFHTDNTCNDMFAMLAASETAGGAEGEKKC